MNLKSIADELKKKLQQGVQTAGNAWSGYVQNVAKPLAVGVPQVQQAVQNIAPKIQQSFQKSPFGNEQVSKQFVTGLQNNIYGAINKIPSYPSSIGIPNTLFRVPVNINPKIPLNFVASQFIGKQGENAKPLALLNKQEMKDFAIQSGPNIAGSAPGAMAIGSIKSISESNHLKQLAPNIREAKTMLEAWDLLKSADQFKTLDIIDEVAKKINPALANEKSQASKYLKNLAINNPAEYRSYLSGLFNDALYKIGNPELKIGLSTRNIKRDTQAGLYDAPAELRDLARNTVWGKYSKEDFLKQFKIGQESGNQGAIKTIEVLKRNGLTPASFYDKYAGRIAKVNELESKMSRATGNPQKYKALQEEWQTLKYEGLSRNPEEMAIAQKALDESIGISKPNLPQQPLSTKGVEETLKSGWKKHLNNASDAFSITKDYSKKNMKLTPEEDKLVNEFFNYANRPENQAKYQAGANDAQVMKDFIKSKGVESMTPVTKESLNTQLVDGLQKGNLLSKKQLQGEISTRTMANQEASLNPIISKGQLNVNKLNVQGAGKEILQGVQQPTTVIGNKEVVSLARTAKGTGTLSDETMKKLMAQQLKNRQVVVDLTKKFNDAKAGGASEVELGKIMLEMVSQSRTAQQGGTFAGRLLQAQNIVADESASPMQKIFALLDNAGVKEDKYLKDAVKVDWNNPTNVVSFYRKFVPPKFGEVLDEIRYSNMLSSPLTHITNIASNAVQTGIIAPIEKTLTGVIDFGKSLLTGSERQYYAKSGIDYAGGYVKALPDAFKKALKVMGGEETLMKPDYERIPTGSTGLLKAYTAPLRALESMDQFFKTLVESGVTNELKKGPQKLTMSQVSSKASKEADYRLFRQAFDPNGELGQGGVLKMFDKWNSAIANLRRLPGGKWVLPFLQTPTNILKQGVEYSPLGAVTAIGAKAPVEQLSKAILGTGVFMGAYQLAKNGLTSWEAPPSNSKESDLYYAAGMQPYSIKMGDKWVSFSKLGPLSYPIAMAAALADAERQNPDKSKVDNIGKGMSGILGFFGDQSYVRSIGDLVDAIKGGGNIGSSAVTSEASNLLGQLIPYKSFLTWVGRMTDPVYRKATTFKEKLVKDLPVLGSQLQPYTDVSGSPSARDFPIYNSFSPYKATQEKPSEASFLQKYQEKKISNQVAKRADEAFKSGDQTQQQTGEIFRYIDDNGNVQKVDLSFPVKEYKPTGNELLDKELLSKYKSSITTAKNNVIKAWEQGAITQDEAIKKIEELTTQYDKTKKPKKPAKVSLKVTKYTPAKITIKKRSALKVPTIKVAKPKVKKTKIRRYTIK